MGIEEGQTSSLDQKGDVTIEGEGSHSPSPQGTLPLSHTRKQSPSNDPPSTWYGSAVSSPLYLHLLSLPIHPRERGGRKEWKKKQWVEVTEWKGKHWRRDVRSEE